MPEETDGTEKYSGDHIDQRIDVDEVQGSIFQIGKIVVRTAQAIDERIFKRLGVEQRLGFLIVSILVIGSAIGLYMALRAIASPGPNATLPPPNPMGGDFNVAVAEFGELDEDGGVIESVEGQQLSEVMAETLQDALKGSNLEEMIEVRPPTLIGRVEGSDSQERVEEAKRLANDHNADLIIYGYLSVHEDETSLSLEFYLSKRQLRYAEELSGHYDYGVPLKVADNITRNPVARGDLENLLIDKRASGLARFVMGLGHFALFRYDEAAAFFNQANETPGWEDEDGKEVLYLFMGTTASKRNDLDAALSYYEQALRIKQDDYARARIGIAQIKYIEASGDSCQPGEVDEQGLDEALIGYDQALRDDRLPSDEIPSKASLGTGRVYLCKSMAEIGDFWDLAEREYEKIIFEFDERDNESEKNRLKYLAAEARADLGLIYWINNEGENVASYRQAIEEFEAAIALSRQPDRQAAFALNKAWIHLLLDECNRAQEALARADDAVEEFKDLNPETDVSYLLTYMDTVQANWQLKCEN